MTEFRFAKLSLAMAIKLTQDRLGMTDDAIASELGTRPSTVRRWKTGKHVPAYKTIKPLQAIARRANVEIDPSSMVR